MGQVRGNLRPVTGGISPNYCLFLGSKALAALFKRTRPIRGILGTIIKPAMIKTTIITTSYILIGGVG